MRTTAPIPPASVQVSVHGDVPDSAAGYARDKISAVIRRARRPVLDARVRITVQQDPAVPRPFVAGANIDLNGRPVIVRVAAPTAREAVDLLVAKLRTRLDRSTRQRHDNRGRLRLVEAGENRPAGAPAAGAPRVLRRGSFLATATVDEAARELDAMGYEFCLFTEAGSGEDSVLFRDGPTGLRLAQVEAPVIDRLSGFTAPVTISGSAAPLLDTEEAIERLELSGLPFLFFLDAGTDCGRVLYHRRDGHYGLITPAE